MSREVWTFADADIMFFSEPVETTLQDFIDGTEAELIEPAYGVPDDDLLLLHCYENSGRLSCRSPGMRRRGVTGRGARVIVPSSQYYDEVELNIGWMLFNADAELDYSEIFNNSKILRIIMKFTSFENPEKKFTLCLARASGFEINGQQADAIEATADFMAELML